MEKTTEKLCEKVIKERARRDELKEKVDAAEEVLKVLEAELSEALATEKGAKVKHAGFTFSVATKVSWKALTTGKDRLLEILKEGAPELVKETVNSSSLSSYLRKNEKSLETEEPAWWCSAKEYLSRSETAALSIRKAAVAKNK